MQCCLFIIQAVNRYLLQISVISQCYQRYQHLVKTLPSKHQVLHSVDRSHAHRRWQTTLGRQNEDPVLLITLPLPQVVAIFCRKVRDLLIVWPRNSVHCRDDTSPNYRQITGMIYIPDLQCTLWTPCKRILVLWEPRVACKMQIMHSSMLSAVKCLT